MNAGRVLAHDEVGANGDRERVALLVHGILGSRKNWRSIAERAVAAVDGLTVWTVDLRGHGESHGFSPPHTVEACARDLGELFAHLGREPDVVVGHSFGGKVVMAYAQRVAAELQALWVLDTTPGPARPGGGTDEVRAVIEQVSAVSLPILGRRELVDDLRARGLSRSLAMWMTTNLVKAEGGFHWAFDLDVIHELLASYAELDAWPVLESPPSGVEVHLVRGARSDRFDDDDQARLDAIERARPGTTHALADAGHWVHSDNPEGLLELLLPSLRGDAR